MLSTPKKGGKKNEPAAPSETASFKKVAYGFSPDEVNLYMHSLRKKNLELQAENDALTAANDPEKAARMENLERNFNEANDRYRKEKELTTMLEVECGRLGEELDRLTNQMSESGSTAAQAKAKIAKAEAKTHEAEINVAKAEAKVVDAEANLAEANANLAKAQNKLGEFETRATEYQTIIAEYDKKLKEYEKRIAELEEDLENVAGVSAYAAGSVQAPVFDEIMAPGDIPAAPVVKSAPTPAAKAVKVAPRAASEVDLDFSEFQVPSLDAPIFEEAPELGEGLADKLSNVLAEIDDLKSQLSRAKEAEAEEAARANKAKKPKKDEDSINNARLSRAELKIQIFQEEAEDSYIIPEKYLKMIEDAEAQDDDDDFSYLLTDTSPMDDMAVSSDDDDDLANLMVGPPAAGVPSFSKAPPPAPRKQQTTVTPAVSPIRMAPRPAPKKPDDVMADDDFAARLNSSFNTPEPRGENLTPRNPLKVDKGEDLKPRNPFIVEKGADLGEDLFELMVGEPVTQGKNVRARTDENIGYDFMLESDDAEII
ncbi:MAG: hypothetical protein FWE74_08885 [Oscillospiraceae bacterium]|nr:hypothetical protein [Oscillospiraceae bacterium]